MRFALFYEIPVARPWGPDSERQAYQDTLEQAVAGERAGCDAFWTVEHHFLEEYSHCSNPEVLYGAIAAKTERIRLGYGVRLMPKPYNHPVRTAESVAVLDLISRRSGRLRHRPFGDAHRARGLRHRSARDAGDVAGGDRARRRLLDERRVRVRRQALADAEAPGAAEADAEAASAAVGRDDERRRSPPGRRARARPVLVRRRRAARRGEGEDRHLPRGRSPTAREPIGKYVHNEAATFTMVLLRADRATRRGRTRASRSSGTRRRARARSARSPSGWRRRKQDLGNYAYAADMKRVDDDGIARPAQPRVPRRVGRVARRHPRRLRRGVPALRGSRRRPAALPREPVQDPAREGHADDRPDGQARHPRVHVTERRGYIERAGSTSSFASWSAVLNRLSRSNANSTAMTRSTPRSR